MKKSADVVRGRIDRRKGLRTRVRRLVALCLVFAAASPALAKEPVRIGMGFGLAFLPAYICEDLKLIEKHGKEAISICERAISGFSALVRCKMRLPAGRLTWRRLALRLCLRPGKRPRTRRGRSSPFPG
jgi:hypothetical protein